MTMSIFPRCFCSVSLTENYQEKSFMKHWLKYLIQNLMYGPLIFILNGILKREKYIYVHALTNIYKASLT